MATYATLGGNYDAAESLFRAYGGSWSSVGVSLASTGSLWYEQNGDTGDFDLQVAGVVFQPADAQSTLCKITLTRSSAVGGGRKVRVYGVKSLSPAEWSTSNRPYAAPRTTAYVDWTFPATGLTIVSPDLLNIYNEIAGQSGWAAGNRVGFVLVPEVDADPGVFPTAIGWGASALLIPNAGWSLEVLSQSESHSGTATVEGAGVVSASGRNPLALTGAATVAGEGSISVGPGTSVRSGTATPSGTGVIDAAGPLYTYAANQYAPSFAAFGGVDPYVAVAGGPEVLKGAVSRGGERYIGGRKDLSRGDRVFVTMPLAELQARANAGTVQKAHLVLTPFHIATWDHSPVVAEEIAKLRTVTSALDLATCTPEDALAATLSGDIWTLSAEPLWLMGQSGYNTAEHAKPTNPIRIDVTTAANAALSGGTDLRLCLEFLGTASDKTVTEFFGALRPDLQPRIEVVTRGQPVTISADVETGWPRLTANVPSTMSAVMSWRWGYTPDCEMGGEDRDIGSMAGALAFGGQTVAPPLDTSRRVYQKIEWTPPSGALHRLEWNGVTPRVFTPMLGAWVNDAAEETWEDMRGPVTWSMTTATHRFVVLTKSAGVWSCRVTPMQQFHGAVSPRWEPLSTTANGYDAAANRWGDPYAFKVGGVGNGAWIPPEQNPGESLIFTLTDTVVGDLWWDRPSQCVHFLSAGFNAATSKWDIRLNQVFSSVLPITGWTSDDGELGSGYRRGAVIYSATAEPDLRVSAISRAHSFFTQMEQEPWQTLVCAFVADGSLRVYRNTGSEWPQTRYWNGGAWTFFGGAKWTPKVLGPWASEFTAVGTPTSLEFLHPCTRGGTLRLVLVAKNADGSGALYPRSPDEQTWHATNGWYITPGTWGTTRAFPRATKYAFLTNQTLSAMDHRMWERGVQVWKDEHRRTGGGLYVCTEAGITSASGCGPSGTGTAISDGTATWKYLSAQTGHLPDMETVHVGLVHDAPDSLGSFVTLYKADCIPATVQVRHDPGPDWNNAEPDWTRHIVDRWPSLDPTAKVAHPLYGGAVVVELSGADGAKTLRVQRIYDQFRVSTVAELTNLPVTGSEVHLPLGDTVWDSMAFPVIVGSPGHYRSYSINTVCEASRYHCPTHDTWWWLSRWSDLSVADFKSDGPHMRLEGLTQLPGNNVFALHWFWDPESYSGGIMNNAGALCFRVANTRGKSLKVNVYASPIGRGAWIHQQDIPGTTAYPGTPENVGGMEWPVAKLDTWWWSKDGGVSWERIVETDYVLDGESGGGISVINLPYIDTDEILISHDPTYSLDMFVRDVARWRERAQTVGDTAYNLVHQVNAQGELLTRSGAIASQTYLDRAGRKCTVISRGVGTAVVQGVGDNFKGVVIEDPARSIANKRLVVVWGAEDSSEMSAARVVRAQIEKLLDGSTISRGLLRQYVFLFMPLAAQQAIRDGWSRYGMAAEFVNEVSSDDIIWTQPSENLGWGRHIADADLFTREFVKEYVAARIAAKGSDDQQSIAALVTWHADTHSSPDRSIVGWPYTTPYAEMEWDTTQFKPAFAAQVHPEFFTVGTITPGAAPSFIVTKPVAQANGAAEMYFEIPWR